MIVIVFDARGDGNGVMMWVSNACVLFSVGYFCYFEMARVYF